MNKAFVDTWAWFALVDRDNADHEIARLANEELLERHAGLVTTNFVVSEAVTLVRYKLNHTVAVRFRQTIRRLVRERALVVVRVSEEQETAAGEIFEKYKDVAFSFTDCTSFVVMREMGLAEAFTSDGHFRIMGFTLIP